MAGLISDLSGALLSHPHLLSDTERTLILNLINALEGGDARVAAALQSALSQTLSQRVSDVLGAAIATELLARATTHKQAVPPDPYVKKPATRQTEPGAFDRVWQVLPSEPDPTFWPPLNPPPLYPPSLPSGPYAPTDPTDPTQPYPWMPVIPWPTPTDPPVPDPVDPSGPHFPSDPDPFFPQGPNEPVIPAIPLERAVQTEPAIPEPPLPPPIPPEPNPSIDAARPTPGPRDSGLLFEPAAIESVHEQLFTAPVLAQLNELVQQSRPQFNAQTLHSRALGAKETSAPKPVHVKVLRDAPQLDELVGKVVAPVVRDALKQLAPRALQIGAVRASVIAVQPGSSLRVDLANDPAHANDLLLLSIFSASGNAEARLHLLRGPLRLSGLDPRHGQIMLPLEPGRGVFTPALRPAEITGIEGGDAVFVLVATVPVR